MAKKARELSTWAKDSSKTQTAGPKVDKCNFTKDVCVYDLLVMNFLSSSSACIKLVDYIHQVSDLGMFSNLSLEKQKEAVVYLLQKCVVLVVEAIRNSSDVASSFCLA